MRLASVDDAAVGRLRGGSMSGFYDRFEGFFSAFLRCIWKVDFAIAMSEAIFCIAVFLGFS
jgi:hypothetical protein